MTQPVQTPDLEVQREAMKKLQFLVGRWAGEACLYRGQNEPTVLEQAEEAQYKLDGLILLIEGLGRTKADSKPSLQALGIISCDDANATYKMRAFNDGRFLETEVRLLQDGTGLQWGFALGEIRTSSVLRINEKGEWTEHAEIRIGAQPAKKLMELTVRRLDSI